MNELMDLVNIVVEALKDKKAHNIKVIDISEISIMADYFIIASGMNKNQIQAMSDIVQEKLHEAHLSPKQIEGYDTANWVLMDYRDMVIHLFDNENRDFYNIERVWADGKDVAI